MPSRPNRYRPGRSRARRSANGWLLPVIAIALGVIVVIAVVRGLGPKGSTTASARKPVPAAVMHNLSQIPLATWNAVGAQGATPPVFVGPATASATVSAAGKPLVFYLGAEFCPFCAAERWSMVTALGRFGSFQGLSYTHSASNDVYPNTPTFTFYGATYKSAYIALQTVETSTNVPGGPGGYTLLQTPNTQQQALVNTYDATPYVSSAAAGHIPFLLVGKRYVWVGAAYSPQVLTGDQQQIAAGLPAGKSAAARAILVNANEIAAAICAVDGGKPGAVCGSAAVAAAAKTLPTSRGQ